MGKEIITNNFRKTQKLGEECAKEILKLKLKKEGAFIIALEGELGSGKTTFVQGMAQGLGIKEQITSPSFVLIKKYKIKLKTQNSKLKTFHHIDCYRLEKPWQLQELGFEEIISDSKNIVAIEWAERVEEILPEDAIKIKFEWLDENKRKIICGKGKI